MSTVADLIVDGLSRSGVTRVFVAANEGPAPELMRAAERAGLPAVICRQEWAACVMAAVTGELTGRPGAALSGTKAGAAASAPGIAHAWLDRAPMLYLSERTGASTTEFTKHDALDLPGLPTPIVKGTVAAAAVSASHAVAHAVHLALAEPRGPVHLDVSTDVARQSAVPMALSVEPVSASPPGVAALDQAAAMILAAQRPLVIVGLECRRSDTEWLRAFCEATPAPVLTTPKGKGAMPDPHPLSMGLLGDTPLDAALLARADLLIAIGVDAMELLPRARWPDQARVLSLARSASSSTVAQHGGPSFEVVADLGSILEELAPRLVSRSRADWDVAEIDRLRAARRRAADDALSAPGRPRVVQLAREFTPAGSIATADPGSVGLAAAAHWEAVNPGEFLVSSGLGMPGFALPAAIAAQLVHRDRRVVCFTGRGGLLRVTGELETAARLNLPITVVVLAADDGGGRAVDQRQRDAATRRPADTDVCALARAFGIDAFDASDESAFRSAFFSALAAPGPVLIDTSGAPAGGRPEA